MTKFRIRYLFVVLMIVQVLTACSNVADHTGRLIYVTSSTSDFLSGTPSSSQTSKNEQGSSSTSSGGKESKGSSAESSSKQADKNKSSRSSSKGSSESSTDIGSSSSNGGSGTELPTENDVIAIYNVAVQNNASLSGVQFDFLNKNSASSIDLSGNVKFINRDKKPIFLTAFDNLWQIYSDAGADTSCTFLDGNCTPGYSCISADDAMKYTMILDPQLSADAVKSYKIENCQGDRLLSFEVSSAGFSRYASLSKIFSTKSDIASIQLAYTVTADNYVSDSIQVFGMNDGSTIEMDKTYINIGSRISIEKPITEY